MEKNKHITSILFAVLMLLCFNLKTKADEVTWTNVATAAEFAAAINNSSSANIRLTADIDLSQVTPATSDYLFDITFSGKITGEGKVNGRTVTYSLKNSSYTLFKELDGAEISKLFVKDSKFTGRDLSSGMLADDATSSSFDYVVFSEITAEGSANGYDCDCMGVVVGKASGNCHFTNLGFLNCELVTDGWELGTVAGEATNCSFTNCITNASCQLWADGNSAVIGIGADAYVGGICGWAKNCTMTNCVNFAAVMSDDDCTGGIAGYAYGTTMTDCRNCGAVKNCTKDGFGRVVREKVAYVALGVGAGAAVLTVGDVMTGNKLLRTFNKLNKVGLNGDFQAYLADNTTYLIEQLLNLVATASETLTVVAAISFSVCAALTAYNVLDTPDYMGGMAGYAENNCQFLRCENRGALQCGDSYCGGIVGWLNGSSITSCYNRCIVKTKNSYVGGIVGKCKDSKVKYCLNVASASSFTNETGGIEGEYTSSCNDIGNFTLAEENAVRATCVKFTQENLPSGLIAKALNDSLIAKGQQPIWRQKLGTDFYPSFNDTTKAIVTATTSNYSLVQKISSAGEFVMAVSNPLVLVSLDNDIDMSNSFFMLATETYPFKGTIEGNGYTISNCSYESSSNDNIVSSTDQGHNVALFPWATNATFKNFTIDNFKITQQDETNKGELKTQAFLVGTSNNCIYDGITIRHSSIPLNSDKDYKVEVGALIANSTKDAVSNCSTTSDCLLQGCSLTSNTYVGGLVGLANSSTFTLCHNGATVWANDNDEGGICSYCENCTFDRCLNTGSITGQSLVGGIVGAAKNTTIQKCVNTGAIADDEGNSGQRGGIIAKLESDDDDQTKSYISSCLNFGSISNINDNSGIICHDGVFTNNNENYYSCVWDGNTYTYFNNLYTLDQVNSGMFAYSNADFFQSIDNNLFVTKYPVPIPAAGSVYQNILCNGTVSYSNIFQSTAAHNTDADAVGLCSICGKTYTAPTTITISSATDLYNLSYATNLGMDYSNSFIEMSNDIDMKDITDFAPIGIDYNHSFRGSFDGNEHCIKNLTIKRDDIDGVGVFGCVSGRTSGGNSQIKNLIVDSSCSIDGGSANGVAGIVGCLTSPQGSTSGPALIVQCCANEANVIGNKNVAGIVGGVYNDDNSSLTLYDCYNAGSIQGKKESAGIVGYGRKNIKAYNCVNVGYVTGTVSNHPMIYYNDGGTTSFTNNYQLSTYGTDDNATSVTLETLSMGSICNALNTQGSYNMYANRVWGQNLGTEYYPTFSTLGIRHERNMSSTWGTVCLPYELNSVDDVQLYSVESCDVSSTNGTLTLTPVETIAANTPCFFKKLNSEATSVCFSKGYEDFTSYTGADNSAIKVSTSASGWDIVGTYEDIDSVKNVYYLASDKLWRADKGISINPYRAYLTYTNASPAKSLAIFVDEGDTMTQIGEIFAEGNINFYDQPVYNLAGQRVTGSARGIVIICGKKYLKK